MVDIKTWEIEAAEKEYGQKCQSGLSWVIGGAMGLAVSVFGADRFSVEKIDEAFTIYKSAAIFALAIILTLIVFKVAEIKSAKVFLELAKKGEIAIKIASARRPWNQLKKAALYVAAVFFCLTVLGLLRIL